MLQIKCWPNLHCSISWWGAVFHTFLISINAQAVIVWLLFQWLIWIYDMNACNHVSMTFLWHAKNHILRRSRIFSDRSFSWLNIIEMLLLHWGKSLVFKEHIVHEFMPFYRTIWIGINFHKQLIQLFVVHIFG